MIQELLAKRFYVAKTEAFAWPPVVMEGYLKVILKGVPTRGGSNARYLVNIDFYNVSDRDNNGLSFNAFMVNEGGHFIRWSMQEAGNFLERSLLFYPRLVAGVELASAGTIARLWGEKRRGSLSLKFNRINSAAMTAKALEIEQKRILILTKKPERAEVFRVAAENLKEAAYFADLVRGNTNDINFANQVSDPV